MGTRTSILNYNEIFVDGEQLTVEELEYKVDNLKDNEIMELIMVDRQGNLHFETHTAGLYY